MIEIISERRRTRITVCCIASVDEANLAIAHGADAVRQVRPFGVDVCSGLRTDNDLEKLDIRVGTISAVTEVPSSDKLMHLEVDFGDHRRSILSAIKKEREDPQEIVGRQALFVVNLPPRTMAGVISEGMLFDIGYADKVLPALAVPERPVPNGSRAG